MAYYFHYKKCKKCCQVTRCNVWVIWDFGNCEGKFISPSYFLNDIIRHETKDFDFENARA